MLFQSELPVLNNVMFASEEEALKSKKGLIEIVDSGYGYLYNNEFDSELLKYDERYQNEQNYSACFKGHLQHILDVILVYRDKQIIEIGCGKGYFLELAQKNGCRILGFDPAYEGDNKSIVKQLFVPESLVENSQDEGRLFVMRHVLEHIPNPLSYLKKLSNSARHDDLILIEVPCLNWIVENSAFFDITYEHCNYFDFEGLRRQFGKVYQQEKCFGGQYMFLVAGLASFKQHQFNIDVEMLEKVGKFESGLNYSIKKAVSNKGPSIIWGCAGKGVMWAYHAIVRGAVENIVGFVDINPSKQEKYAPGSWVYCYSPDNIPEEVENIIIVNPNYQDEIMEIAGNGFSYQVV